MDTSNILKPTRIIGKTIFSKIKYFVFASFVSSSYILKGIYGFIDNLNKKGLLGLGSDFKTFSVIWGDTVLLNIIHTLILIINAGLFGFILGYLLRRISLTQKIIFSTLYVFMGFIIIGLVSIIIDNFFSNASMMFDKLIGEFFYEISYSSFNITFFVIGYISQFLFAIYFMYKGESFINNPNYYIDKSKKGTFLDVKWYHFLWLWIPTAFYTTVVLNMFYNLIHTIVTLFQNFKWSTIFGISDGDKGNALDIAWGGIGLSVLVSSAVVFLMLFLIEVLSDKTQYSRWFEKTIISIVISIVIPVLIFLYTNLI